MNTEFITRVILVVIASYLLGSLPTAYLVGRLKGINIFEIGSGNMGATNIIRSAGLKWGLFVWVVDSSKAILAIIIARHVMADYQSLATGLAAIVAVIGHNWSLFAALLTGTLRGGKGAATAFGSLLMVAPLHVIVGVCFIGGCIIAVTRYVSLGVLAMVLATVFWFVVLIQQNAMPADYAVYTLVIMTLILFRFRDNIQRLLAGKERRLGESA